MRTIKCNTIGEMWISAMDSIMENGEDILDGDVRLREIRNLYVSIQRIQEDDPLISKYADRDRINLMKEKYATCGLVGDYKIDYGSYIYNNDGINQIEWIIKRLRNKPETKSATITLHKPGEEMLSCLSMIDFKYRKGYLDMSVIYRSQNIYWSNPGNMLALHKIHNDVAQALGYELGSVELVVISAHIYEKDFTTVNNILKSALKK